MKEKVLISACLLGVNCKYSGDNNYNKELIDKLNEQYDLIPICPEIMGGLSTPRKPAEIRDGKVFNNQGDEVTKNFQKGAEEALKIAKILNTNKAILKSKSPSCGKGLIYDGTFNNKLIEGNGITTDLLLKNKIQVISDKEI
ncbi:MAG: DUF523 domain-containing protein [Bacilli bacterium]|nr:DUF523 domain-containing protein [Bacilli bacterium]